MTPFEADRGIEHAGAGGHNHEQTARLEHAGHLAQGRKGCRQVFEHVRTENRVELAVAVRQAACVGLLELCGDTLGCQDSGSVVQHRRRQVDSSDGGNTGSGTGEGRPEDARAETTVEHPAWQRSPMQVSHSVEVVKEAGVGVGIAEPLHRPLPASRGNIVACR